jgi:DNA-binding MarR family transcriptional regulator
MVSASFQWALEGLREMSEWTLISNHGLVLTYIAKHPQSTGREIASAIKITEWTVHKIIANLEKEGYIERQKVGRRNIYRTNPYLHMRHETIRDVRVGDLLKVLGWRRRQKLTNGGEPDKGPYTGCSSR